MYKILLLTDFSPASRHAITFVQALFQNTAAEFCLVNAFPVEAVEAPGAAFLMTEARENAEDALEELYTSIEKSVVPAYHRYQKLVALGDPVGVVERMLTKERYDLVVVGATGNGNQEWLGSVATGLLRHAKTSVLVVPLTAPIQALKRIVVAIDYRAVDDSQPFSLLVDLAVRASADITLLTIENPDDPQTKASPVGQQSLFNVFSDLSVCPYTIHDSDVLHGIDTYLDTHSVDLLALLPHHKSLLSVLLNKSVSRSLAYHPRVPLLAIFDPSGHPVSTQSEDVDIDRIPYATYF